MEHLCSLLQRHVRTLLQSLRCNEIGDVVHRKLWATWRLCGEPVLGSMHTCLDQFSHGGGGLFDVTRDLLVVKDGLLWPWLRLGAVSEEKHIS
jgi:hypothetical protein